MAAISIYWKSHGFCKINMYKPSSQKTRGFNLRYPVELTTPPPCLTFNDLGLQKLIFLIMQCVYYLLFIIEN